MGIDGEIIKEIKRRTMHLNLKLFFESMPGIDGAAGYIEDSLTRVLWNPGEDGDFMYSGEQFFDMWLKPFMQHLSSFTTHAVSSFDASENVPREKEDTQLARIIAGKKAAAKKEALRLYPETMNFDDGGIYNPGHKETSMEKFDLRAIQQGPRSLRKKLWQYVFSKMKHMNLPDDRTLYLEVDSVSAWKFEGAKLFERDLETAHGHGESDPSMAFWAEKICFHSPEGKTAIIRSKDGDEWPILLHAIEMQQQYAPAHYIRKPVYWVAKAKEIYDMRVVYEYVTTKLKFTESQYMIYCILCGTDFFPKKLICHGFGSKPIFNAFEQIRKAFNVWDTLEAPTDQKGIEDELGALTIFVRQLYHDDIGGQKLSVVRVKSNEHVDFTPRLHSVERLRELYANSNKKAHAMPTDEAIQLAYKKISWNYRYWRSRARWPKGMYGTEPLKRSAVSFLAPKAKPMHVDDGDESSSSSEEEEADAHTTRISSFFSPTPSPPPPFPELNSFQAVPRSFPIFKQLPLPKVVVDAADDIEIIERPEVKRPRVTQKAINEVAEANDMVDDFLKGNYEAVTKRPRVSLASVIAAAAAGKPVSEIESAARLSAFQKEELRKQTEEFQHIVASEEDLLKWEKEDAEQVARWEMEDAEQELKQKATIEISDDEEEAEWTPTPLKIASTASAIAAAKLMKELDEQALAALRNPPPAAICPTATRSTFEGVIHRALGGTNRSGVKRKPSVAEAKGKKLPGVNH